MQTKFPFDTKAINHKDFYSVETAPDGRKIIHIDGYFYRNDHDSWNYVQCTFCYIEIDGHQGDAETLDIAYCETKQYQYDDISESDVREELDSKAPVPLLLSKVTQETPDGWYINM